MDWFSGIVVYVLIWWTVVFCVLPWGIVRAEGGTGAPVKPMLLKKFIITTGISFVIWLLVFWMISADLINFRELSMRMMRKDIE